MHPASVYCVTYQLKSHLKRLNVYESVHLYGSIIVDKLNFIISVYCFNFFPSDFFEMPNVLSNAFTLANNMVMPLKLFMLCRVITIGGDKENNLNVTCTARHF